jgi:hypothetical protein
VFFRVAAVRPAGASAFAEANAGAPLRLVDVPSAPHSARAEALPGHCLRVEWVTAAHASNMPDRCVHAVDSPHDTVDPTRHSLSPRAAFRRFQVQLSTHAFFQCDVHTFHVPSAGADGAAVTTATLADAAMQGRLAWPVDHFTPLIHAQSQLFVRVCAESGAGVSGYVYAHAVRHKP